MIRVFYPLWYKSNSRGWFVTACDRSSWGARKAFFLRCDSISSTGVSCTSCAWGVSFCGDFNILSTHKLVGMLRLDPILRVLGNVLFGSNLARIFMKYPASMLPLEEILSISSYWAVLGPSRLGPTFIATTLSALFQAGNFTQWMRRSYDAIATHSRGEYKPLSWGFFPCEVWYGSRYLCRSNGGRGGEPTLSMPFPASVIFYTNRWPEVEKWRCHDI